MRVKWNSNRFDQSFDGHWIFPFVCPSTKVSFAPSLVLNYFTLIIIALVLSALSGTKRIQMKSIVKLVLDIVGLERWYRVRSIWLRFTVYTPSRAVHDFPQPGDIESCFKIFASTTEIAAGNDAATMFTQTPRVETIHQDSRVRARGLLAVKLAFLRVRDVNRASVAEIDGNSRAKRIVSLRANVQIST